MDEKQSKCVLPNQNQSARGTTQVRGKQPTPSCSNVSQQTTPSSSSRFLAMTPEDERYWRLVKVILDDMPRKLRDLFRSAFQKTYGQKWVDNLATGKFFMGKVPHSKKRDKHITTIVENGISEQFDPTVLFFCLLNSGTNMLLPVARKKESRVLPFYESERVDQLREQRNAVAHATTPSLSEADFQTKIQEIEDIYTQLQWDQTQLKEAAYGRLWPVEYDRLQGEIYAEKARIDDHEQRLQNLQQGQKDFDKRVKKLEQQSQQDQETFVKTVEDNQQLDPRTFIEKLEHKTEPLQLITLVHEAQSEDLVEVVPAEIESNQLHPTEGMALAWMLQQQTCPITTLKLGGLDSHMMMQLCDGLGQNKSIQELSLIGSEGLLKTVEAAEVLGHALAVMTQLCRLQLDSCLSPQALTAISAGLTRGGHQVEYLNLRHNAGLLETIEAGRELGDTLGKMTRLRELELRYCGLTDQSLTALSSGLTRHGGQQLKYLGCGDNPLTDASSDTFRRLLTRCPKLRIWPLGCHLSDECGRQLKEQFGEERFYWESL